jgi:KaiC/GvpD/RAD55 family RecA-like ATPase
MISYFNNKIVMVSEAICIKLEITYLNQLFCVIYLKTRNEKNTYTIHLCDQGYKKSITSVKHPVAVCVIHFWTVLVQITLAV